MYQRSVHSLMVHGLIYAVSVTIYSLFSHILFHLYSMVSTATVVLNVKEKEKQLLFFAYLYIYIYIFFPFEAVGAS